VDGLTVAAVFEAKMTPEQARRLAELMRDARPTRPQGVVTATLHVEDGKVELVPTGATARRSIPTSRRPTSRVASS